MKLDEVLDALRERRIDVDVEGNKLRLRAPAGALTDELRRAVEAHKGSLLQLLSPAPGTEGARNERLLGLLRDHFARMNALRADWAGATARLRRASPTVAAEADRAWERGAHEARRYVQGHVVVDVHLRLALVAHREVWTRAWRLLDQMDRDCMAGGA